MPPLVRADTAPVGATIRRVNHEGTLLRKVVLRGVVPIEGKVWVINHVTSAVYTIPANEEVYLESF